MWASTQYLRQNKWKLLYLHASGRWSATIIELFRCFYESVTESIEWLCFDLINMFLYMDWLFYIDRDAVESSRILYGSRVSCLAYLGLLASLKCKMNVNLIKRTR